VVGLILYEVELLCLFLVSIIITFSFQKWRVLCFKHQNIPSESNDSEFKEDKISQDSVKFKGDEPKDLKKKDWLTALHTVLFSLCILMFHGYYKL